MNAYFDLRLRNTAMDDSHSFIQQYLVRLLCAWHWESNNQQTACPYEEPYSLMAKEDNRQVIL